MKAAIEEAKRGHSDRFSRGFKIEGLQKPSCISLMNESITKHSDYVMKISEYEQ